MVDLVASNLKLKQRSRNILRRLSGKCESMPDTELDAVLLECNGSVKLALLAVETGLSVSDCQSKLDSAGGVLSLALDKPAAKDQANGCSSQSRQYVLCIDGGGTKCAAVIADHTGIVGRGVGGPCNM